MINTLMWEVGINNRSKMYKYYNSCGPNVSVNIGNIQKWVRGHCIHLILKHTFSHIITQDNPDNVQSGLNEFYTSAVQPARASLIW